LRRRLRGITLTLILSLRERKEQQPWPQRAVPLLLERGEG
jgi:hypothetical protein